MPKVVGVIINGISVYFPDHHIKIGGYTYRLDMLNFNKKMVINIKKKKMA